MMTEFTRPTMPLLDVQIRDLARLGQQNRLRRLIPRAEIEFSSNDYFGLAGSARLANAVSEALGRGIPMGSGGLRLLRGNYAQHEELEDEAAEFFCNVFEP